jgi:hypothetical protein
VPRWVLAALLSLAATPGWAATTYCCSDGEGRQICADRVPPQCIGRSYRELNERGVTVRQFAASQASEVHGRAEDTVFRERERVALDQRRRDRALLDTYANEQEIVQLRDRRLREADDALHRARLQLQEAQTRPQVKATDSELRQLDALVKDRQRDIEAIKARFEDDRRRFGELGRASPR